MKLLRCIVALLLIAFGVWMLSGCIYVPMFGRPLAGGKNVSKQVGDAKSKKPIRIGKSSAGDIIAKFGAPYAQSADGEVLVYTWKSQNGVTIWPLCFAVEGVDKWSSLVLRIDERGILESTEVLVNSEPAIDLFGYHGSAPLPPEVSADDWTSHVEPVK